MCMQPTLPDNQYETGIFESPHRMYKVIKYYGKSSSHVGPYSLVLLPHNDDWLAAAAEPALKTTIRYKPGFHVFGTSTDAELYNKDLSLRHTKVIPVNVLGSYTKGLLILDSSDKRREITCYAVQKLQVANKIVSTNCSCSTQEN